MATAGRVTDGDGMAPPATGRSASWFAVERYGDDGPGPFEPIHSDVSGADTDSDDEEDEPECEEHGDCDGDDLCVDSECVDREDALEDCWNDDDCPDGFVCYEEMRCIED